MKKVMLILGAAGFFFSAMTTLSAAENTVSIRMITPFAQGHILADVATQFKIELEKTAPQFRVDVTAGVLNEQSIDPAMQSCQQEGRAGDMMLTGAQPIQDYAPAYFFFNGPYVIRDYAHLLRVWHGPIGQAMTAQLERTGQLITFEPTYRGFRQFTANKPIQQPVAAQDLRLRLPPTPDWIAVWSSLGAKPVQVPLPGIYAALKTGAAEASEGDLTQILSLRLYEVQTHLTLTNHIAAFGMPMANACFWRSLSPDQQEAVRAAMLKATRWGTAQIQANETAMLDELRRKGMQVVKPDEAALRQAVAPAINQLFATQWTVTTWQDVLSY